MPAPIKHGLTHHPLYGIWGAMIRRCTHPHDPEWKNYGGRGIAVCERWASVQNFIDDMGERPPNMTLERLNNDLNYSPENCQWASRTVQARNKRTNRLITFNNKTQCLTAWAKEVGLSNHGLRYRLKLVPPDVALTAQKCRGAQKLLKGVRK